MAMGMHEGVIGFLSNHLYLPTHRDHLHVIREALLDHLRAPRGLGPAFGGGCREMEGGDGLMNSHCK